MASLARRLGFGTARQLEVLTAMESFIRKRIEAHRGRRKLWFPNDLQPADAGAEDEALTARLREAARHLPAAVLVALALNLLTEEGLPHFHRLIAQHMGQDSAWCEWNNVWTAEEDRHGCAIRDYVRDARVFRMGALERLQYQYIEAGFEPDWEQDPYRLLAYTSLQEKATQVSHANTGRAAADYEPRLQRMLAHVAGDESRHYQFYRALFGEVLSQDPDTALHSLQKVALGFAMPGHNIAGFDDMSEVVRRGDIFGPRQYQEIVEELLDHWKIGALTGLSPEGRQAQDKLMKVPARLSRMADYVEAKSARRGYQFEFLPAGGVEV
ncbi:MAG: acyl-ACP desaturase [Gammaproteobacteria bacterium]|nr:acyl-ACP desaturase [Gammaproteobacteria bacterium]